MPSVPCRWRAAFFLALAASVLVHGPVTPLYSGHVETLAVWRVQEFFIGFGLWAGLLGVLRDLARGTGGLGRQAALRRYGPAAALTAFAAMLFTSQWFGTHAGTAGPDWLWFVVDGANVVALGWLGFLYAGMADG